MRRKMSLAACACLLAALFVSFHRTVAAQPSGVSAKLEHTIAESWAFWWSPDNKTLAVQGKVMSLYDTATGKARAEIKLEGYPMPRGVYFTPDGAALVIHTDRVRLYAASDGKLLREFAEDTTPIQHYEKIFQVQEVSSYNYETGTTETTWVGPNNVAKLTELPTAYLSDRHISPDGKSLLVRAKDGKAQVYDLTTGALKFTLEPFVEPGNKKDRAGDALGEFSADGRFIVTAHRNRTPRLWNAATGALVADLTPQTDAVFGVRFSHDSRFVVTSSWEGVVKTWETATGKLRQSIGTKKDKHYFAAWNPKQNTFVTKSREWEVHIWSAETGALVAKLDKETTKEKFDENVTFVYSPDGRILLTQARNINNLVSVVGGLVRKKPRLIAHLWDAGTGALIKSLRDDKERSTGDYLYDKFFWTPSGDYLVTAGMTVKLWDRRGELRQQLDGNALMNASLSPDGKLLAITGEKPGGLGSLVIDVAKIMVGKLPKFTPQKTYVWRIEG